MMSLAYAASRRTKIWSSSPGNVRQFVHNIAPAPSSGEVEYGKPGADLDSTNAEVETALTFVARTGKVDAAKLLLDARAKVSVTERFKASRLGLIAAPDDPLVDLGWEHHALVDLPDAYQVTQLMIRAAWGATNSPPADATDRPGLRRSAQNPTPSGRRHPSPSCQRPDHSPPRSGAETQPFGSWRKMTPTPNRKITMAKRRWTRPTATTVTRRLLGQTWCPGARIRKR
jgi:hypothetical protein